MIDNPPIALPQDAICIGCGYPLRGLPSETCPECGRVFQPADPSSYTRQSEKVHRLSRSALCLLAIPYLLVLALIIYAERAASLVVIWNCLPVAAAFFILVWGLHGRAARVVATIVFSLVVLSMEGLIHLAWEFNWGKVKTGSSTSGLVFLFVPLWAILFGSVAAAIGYGLATLINKLRGR